MDKIQFEDGSTIGPKELAYGLCVAVTCGALIGIGRELKNAGKARRERKKLIDSIGAGDYNK